MKSARYTTLPHARASGVCELPQETRDTHHLVSSVHKFDNSSRYCIMCVCCDGKSARPFQCTLPPTTTTTSASGAGEYHKKLMTFIILSQEFLIWLDGPIVRSTGNRLDLCNVPSPLHHHRTRASGTGEYHKKHATLIILSQEFLIRLDVHIVRYTDRHPPYRMFSFEVTVFCVCVSVVAGHRVDT